MNRETSLPVIVGSYRDASCLSEKQSTKCDTYISHQKLNHLTDVTGSIFVGIIQMILGEVAIISTDFDVGILSAPFILPKSIVYGAV